MSPKHREGASHRIFDGIGEIYDVRRWPVILMEHTGEASASKARAIARAKCDSTTAHPPWISTRGDSKMAKIYYAHAVCKYNTSQEAKELQQIKERFPQDTIINPNGKAQSMRDCYDLLDTCDTVVVTESWGFIGKCVYSEIMRAFSHGKQVVLLRDEQYHPINSHFQLEMVDNNYFNINIGIPLKQLYLQQVKQRRIIKQIKQELVDAVRCARKERTPSAMEIPDNIPANYCSFWLHVGKLRMLEAFLGLPFSF